MQQDEKKDAFIWDVSWKKKVSCFYIGTRTLRICIFINISSNIYACVFKTLLNYENNLLIQIMIFKFNCINYFTKY